MATLFERDRTIIVKHIAKIFSEGELDKKSNVHFFHIANSDKPVKLYNLNVIISVGYRVKSQRGTQFRIGATQMLVIILWQFGDFSYPIINKRLALRNIAKR